MLTNPTSITQALRVIIAKTNELPTGKIALIHDTITELWYVSTADDNNIPLHAPRFIRYATVIVMSAAEWAEITNALRGLKI